MSDLEPLKGLTGLKRLYLQGTQVSDLEPLKGLTKLRWSGANCGARTTVPPGGWT